MNTKKLSSPPSPYAALWISRARKGMTIIEISIVLALMMGLASVVVFSASGIGKWKLARNASLDLKSVYVAQKSYLADHPTQSIANVTATELGPYMPMQGASIPTVESLDGAQLPVNFNVMPPVAVSGGAAYDPSGSSSDGLWDVGKP